MSTRAFSSTIINVPINFVWQHLRDFTFPERLFDSVESCTMEDDLPPTTVGASRTIVWSDGQSRVQRLLEVSDQFHRVVYELEMSDPPAEYTACITTIQLYRVTDTQSTYISWSSDFSTDVAPTLVVFEQKAYADNLEDLAVHLVEKYRGAQADLRASQELLRAQANQ
eukprot:TRINITY_DN2081_c0_g1_i1.p1 TRINITY_DN2081_c0_g1~~TRINITY_DN2081_c0_g1_i1.p1  ORF type:complete len:168 (-),score=47.39 TRINITY_DN2081_c0_g1_i1:46-549(-)